MSTFLTPLRYPGGKGRMGPWLSELLRHNDISGGCYVEPYAGGAGAALYLLMYGYVDHIIINDLDPAVYSFWWSLLNQNDGFIDLLNTTDVTIDNWYVQKDILSNHSKYDPLTVGFATFFLNRTNRSGILSGGVIGGKAQSGVYKLDARYNKEELCNRIRKIGSMRNFIDLFNLDACDLIDQVRDSLPKKSLIYLDPPYYEKGSQLYRNHYKPHDHQIICDKVMAMSTPVIVTYDNCNEIRELYKNENKIEFSFHYSTHLKRPKVTELMIYKNLKIHSVPSMKKK
ncbi:DNA adenine methylase [Enterobacter hormaechei]|uniref:DNA adenine methylase n=1 Tax=Enterobacter hormaechei TaxID=158836 RepID=UPI003C2B1985